MDAVLHHKAEVSLFGKKVEKLLIFGHFSMNWKDSELIYSQQFPEKSLGECGSVGQDFKTN